MLLLLTGQLLPFTYTCTNFFNFHIATFVWLNAYSLAIEVAARRYNYVVTFCNFTIIAAPNEYTIHSDEVCGTPETLHNREGVVLVQQSKNGAKEVTKTRISQRGGATTRLLLSRLC